MKTQRSKNYLAELHAEQFYHVYNRTNNKETLFRNDRNRELFLNKYEKYLKDYLHTYAYCLLDNHFHLLVRIRTDVEIFTHIQKVKEYDRTVAQKQLLEMDKDERTVHKVLERQFKSLFTSYAMNFNKMWRRSGNLFYRPFKRRKVQNEGHFTHLIKYIHTNPVKHGLTNDFTSYPWSSYQAFLSDESTNLEKQEVFDWFGGKVPFLAFHQEYNHLEKISDLIIGT